MHTPTEMFKRNKKISGYIYLSFIRSGCFYSTSLSPLLLRGAPDTARRHYCAGISHGSATGNCEWRTCPRLERDSNPWPFGRKASTLPMRHTCPTNNIISSAGILITIKHYHHHGPNWSHGHYEPNHNNLREVVMIGLNFLATWIPNLALY